MQLSHLVPTAVGIAMATGLAAAQTWPTRPIRLVLPSSAGGANDLKEFVATSKKSANGFHWGTAGTGSTPHFIEGLLETRYGAKLDVVPYKSGRLKALASTWPQRISAAPALSTAAEQGFPESRIAHWAGVHAPHGTPEAVMDRLAAAIDAAMKTPATGVKEDGPR